jgi:hypothetical protein
MARRKLKRGHNPEFYDCQNPECARTTPLALKHYGATLPDNVAPEEVHYVHQPLMGGFTILCASCGHYTVVSPFQRRRAGG